MNHYEKKDSGYLIRYLSNKYKDEELCVKEYEGFYCIQKKQVEMKVKELRVVIPKAEGSEFIGDKLFKRIIQYFKQFFGY